MANTTDLTNFKAEILSNVGVIEISKTLEHRVLIVKDERGRLRVSSQVWWRDTEQDMWKPGKGFFLASRTAKLLAKHILSKLEGTMGTYDGDLELTDTQRYRIERDEDLITISKIWRKGDNDDWKCGKSISLKTDEAKELCFLLNRGAYSIK